ncbi:CaiB/BaiF CoA transferase family protein [Polaromonas sp.]|uniref:CaiB/BaiF CoA transferase family protein n=1 Tax=Polaromonas sp. TaxID=1869339 RepID=UPI003751EE78
MGPLKGVKVLEIEAMGPVPWAAMMLSDMGADVLRLDRPVAPDIGVVRDKKFQFTERGRRSVIANLKDPAGAKAALALVSKADVLLEGMRPGVMERLGLGPEQCLAINPALIYGRMTGWGQTGPLAHAVGHDINYIAVAGVLHAIGTADTPVPPLNLVGDYGGGGMLLALGVMAALIETKASGHGQVVDAAMIDGSMSMMAAVLGRHAAGEWKDQRQSNMLDGGAHFYGIYATSDGKHVAVGAIEPHFYKALLAGLGLDDQELPAQHDQQAWPALRLKFAAIFCQNTRDHWCTVFEGTEACVSPVLSLTEIAAHPHNAHRRSFVDIGGIMHPAPSPRFSRTPGRIAGPPVDRGFGGAGALVDWGFEIGDPELAGLSCRSASP